MLKKHPETPLTNTIPDSLSANPPEKSLNRKFSNKFYFKTDSLVIAGIKVAFNVFFLNFTTVAHGDIRKFFENALLGATLHGDNGADLKSVPEQAENHFMSFLTGGRLFQNHSITTYYNRVASND